MSLYYNKKLISGIRDIPSMTLADYNLLTNKPKLWIRTDAPDSDRGINSDDIAYDINNSVKDKIDGMSSHILVWSGSLYTVNDEFSITNYSSSKNYVFKFNSFSGGGYSQQFFVSDTTNRMQFIIQGETDQYRRYRIAPKTGSTGTFVIEDTYGQGDSGTALCEIYEIT